MNKIIDLVLTFIKSFFYAVSPSCFKKNHKSTHHKTRTKEHEPQRKRKTSITETTTKTTEITFETFGNSSSSPDTNKETTDK